MGNFDKELYDAYKSDDPGINCKGERAEEYIDDEICYPIARLRVLGTWFLMFFLLVNMIILLNFVIAILGNTFAEYET